MALPAGESPGLLVEADMVLLFMDEKGMVRVEGGAMITDPQLAPVGPEGCILIPCLFLSLRMLIHHHLPLLLRRLYVTERQR